MSGMGKIKLPRTMLSDASEGIVIKHLKTGVSVTVAKAKLDSWAISQLRAMISAPSVPAVAGSDSKGR